MSSTESSGAPAEASATPPAPAAAFPSFGSTRGSGLARGKRPTVSPAASAAASVEYTPTAIEVISAPREYQNPFAPANAEPATPAVTPAAAGTEPVGRAYQKTTDHAADGTTLPSVAPAEVAPIPAVEPAGENPENSEAAAPAARASLNILDPEQRKAVQAQTWESEGFRPSRERSEHPRREERVPRQEQPVEPVDIASIPEKFLYVRAGHTYVPTPANYGGAPRERRRDGAGEDQVRAVGTVVGAPPKPGGFLGWLKSLFGGPSAAPATSGNAQDKQHHEGGRRRHRGGRNRGGQGRGGEDGGQRRSRGGRGRGGYRSGGTPGSSAI